jgi:hypothetical protein
MANTLIPAISSQWLNLIVNQSLVDREFERRNLEVSSQQRAQAESDASQIFGGPEAFAAFPEWFRSRMIDRQARAMALTDDLPSSEPSEDSLRALWSNQLESSCPAERMVSHILVSSEAEAAAIAAELAQGADFGELARSRSLDQTTAESGGVLFCVVSQTFTQTDQAFQDATTELAEASVAGGATEQVSAPVRTPAGYHIIKVSPWTYENARPLVLRSLEQRESPLTRWLNRELRRADVWVDPRYGRAVRTGGTVFIEPPTIPEPSEKPAPPTAPAVPTPTP